MGPIIFCMLPCLLLFQAISLILAQHELELHSRAVEGSNTQRATEFNERKYVEHFNGNDFICCEKKLDWTFSSFNVLNDGVFRVFSLNYFSYFANLKSDTNLIDSSK